MDATKLDACVTKVDALAKRMDTRMGRGDAALSELKIGDKVRVKKYMEPDGGKRGTINNLRGGGVKVDLDDGNSETFAPSELDKV